MRKSSQNSNNHYGLSGSGNVAGRFSMSSNTNSGVSKSEKVANKAQGKVLMKKQTSPTQSAFI